MTPLEDKQKLSTLRSILAEVGPGGIWRPVYDHNGRRLADGVGDPLDGVAAELPEDFFKGKRVVDIGCNFGTFSFLAARMGAAHVLGVDIDERIITGCRILKELLGIENVEFLAEDLRQLDRRRPFDVAMMIDFIGKEVIYSGFMPACLDVMEAISERQMLFSIRPVYSFLKHFGGDRDRLLGFYPSPVVRTKQFLLLEYLRQRFRNRWEVKIISAVTEHFDASKQTILSQRRR